MILRVLYKFVIHEIKNYLMIVVKTLKPLLYIVIKITSKPFSWRGRKMGR